MRISNYCVFNFGSASYFSTRENILFQTHILNNRIQEIARMLSGDEVNDEAIANAKKMLDI